jgi:hypothetical protein
MSPQSSTKSTIKYSKLLAIETKPSTGGTESKRILAKFCKYKKYIKMLLMALRLKRLT